MKKMKSLTVVFIFCLLFGFMGTAWTAEHATKIDINAAPVEMLTQLKGIGPSLAKRIVEYREANGGFQSIEDLKQVGGIGEKTFADIRNDIAVAPDGTKE